MVDFPNNPQDGDTHTEEGTTWTYFDPPGAWAVVSGGGGTPTTSGSTFPSTPAVGDLHYLTVAQIGLYIYYDDGNSQQWVQTNPSDLEGGGGGGGGGWESHLGNGIYDDPFYSGAAVGEIVTPTFEDGYEYRILSTGVTVPVANRKFEVVFVGSVSGDSDTSLVYEGIKFFEFDMTLPFPDANKGLHWFDITLVNDDGSLFADGRKVVGHDFGTPQKLRGLKFSLNSSNFTGGAMYLLRRALT